jgi:hypothetical protein
VDVENNLISTVPSRGLCCQWIIFRDIFLSHIVRTNIFYVSSCYLESGNLLRPHFLLHINLQKQYFSLGSNYLPYYFPPRYDTLWACCLLNCTVYRYLTACITVAVHRRFGGTYYSRMFWLAPQEGLRGITHSRKWRRPGKKEPSRCCKVHSVAKIHFHQ